MRAEITKVIAEIEQVRKPAEEASLTGIQLKPASTTLTAQHRASPDFWADPEKARVDHARSVTSSTWQVKAVRELEAGIRDNVELIEMGDAEGDADVVKDAEQALQETLKEARSPRRSRRCCRAKSTAMTAIVEIHSGAGGTESQDWANILLRMYTRWAERRKFKVEVLEMHDGEEAGIKSATIKVSGHNAYGWLKTESGVHRLVRISPYDSAPPAATPAFQAAWVYPVVDDSINIEIRESRPQGRYLSRVGRRWAARQHHRLGHPHHPRAVGHRGGLPAGAQPAQEPRHCHGDAEGAAVRS
jgi:peptide chain release factor 2